MAADTRVRRLLPRLLPYLGPMSTRGRPDCPAHLQSLDRATLGSMSDEDLDAVAEHVCFPFEVYLESPWLPDNYTVDALDFLARYHRRVPLRR